MRKTYIKNLASPLILIFVCLGGLDLSKEVLWVYVRQLAAKLQAVKVGGLKKILPRRLSPGGPGSTPGPWDHPPTLTACNLTAS